MIKQIGDALAWNLVRGDPRFLVPLYKPSTHNLPQDHSVDGVIRMLETAAATREYLVVPTDVTRCCGVGDFLIAGSRWPYPSPFEAKVKRQEDGTLFSFLHGWNPVFQVYPDELERFMSAFNLTMPGPVSFDERGERQKAEVNQSTAAEMDSMLSLGHHATPSLKRHWKSIEGVLARAVQGSTACDLAEPGLAYAGVPLRAFANNSLELIINGFHRVGIEVSESDWELATSLSLVATEDLSALLLPIPMWKIESRLKGPLMAGAVVLVTAIRKGLWTAAFRSQGVDHAEDGGKWKISAAGHECVFDAFDVMRMEYGLRFGGVSPQHTAKVLAMQLYIPGSVEVDRYATG